MNMTAKMNSTRFTGGISHEECSSDLLVNPFVHRLELETTYEKIKGLLNLLKYSAEGRILLKQKEKLNNPLRTSLVRIIINELMTNYDHIKTTQFQKIVDEILTIFPRESAETYYIPHSRTNKNTRFSARGKLVSKYHNIRAALRSLNPENKKLENKEIEKPLEITSDCAEKLNYLKTALEPFPKILQFWEETLQFRRKKYRTATIDKIFQLTLKNGYELTAILTVILLPIRVALICFFVITGWIFASIGLLGMTEEELRAKPLDGWRKRMKHVVCFFGKSSFRAGGMNMVVKGKQASRKEAPILVAAPHSTFLDGGIVYVTGFPSTICRRESGANNHIGKLINFTQPVYVWRDDPDSRQNTIKEIINRATSDMDWPQILVFPEGTCTNRSCLITFKPGAFYPGVPIQPVCIRYPNKLDTVTWTWEGPSALKLLWLTLTQPYSKCEIEFLPVYTPSEEEKRDPKLFANNVRALMAKALGVPVIDYTYDDCKLMTKAKEMNLPCAPQLVEVRKLRNRLGMTSTAAEEGLIGSNSPYRDCSKVTYLDFVRLLNIPANNAFSQQLFGIYDKKKTGVIDLREYLLGVLAISRERSALEVLQIACKIYDRSKCGRLTAEDFCKAVCQTLALSKEFATEVFAQVDKNELGYITFEYFVNYAQKKAEFANLFSLSKEEKFPQKNGEICPNLYGKKVD